MLHRTASAILFLISGACFAQSAAPRVELVETRVISHESYFHGWPTLRRLKSGELWVTYSGGRDDHAGPLGRIELMTSKDDGKTWTWPRVVVDTVIDDRDAGLCETASGALLMPFMTSLSYQLHLNDPARRVNKVFGAEAPVVLQRWQAAEDRTTQDEKKQELGPYNGRWMMRSTDGGRTWSTRYPVEMYSLKGPIALSNGRLVYGGSTGSKTGLWESTDDGLTWTFVSSLPLPPGEMDMVEAANGWLIVQVRSARATHQTISKDGGKTWSASAIVAEGYPPQLLRLKDQSILMTYGWRKSPFGIRAKLSHDNGETWSPEMVITDDGADSDLGYPGSAELSDGSLLTVWYEVPKSSKQAVLRQAKWRVR